ncbi:MAG: anthranilate phosphoribosyltransferase [Candidatus Binatia bacterium]|nr:MAG: anthranilate phosphoribosyltransferase [Candidatus Binatia bacterium]
MSIVSVLERLALGRTLGEEEAAAALREIVEGKATEAQIGAFLMALRVRGETVEEIAGAARELRRHAVPVRSSRFPLLDTCGTGGDGAGTFNISTAAALVAAASGVAVAKHGNRAMSGKVGGADVLEKLGVPVELDAERAARMLDEHGFVFLFAPAFHPAMRRVAGPRRELGVRTLFNLLGPLANPASPTHQLLGVFAPPWVEPLARVLGRLGVRRALVVHGHGGLDEISPAGPTVVAEFCGDGVRRYEIEPRHLGSKTHPVEALRVGSAAESARRIVAVLEGREGADFDVVAMNAGAALYAAERTSSLAEGVELARTTLRSGRARSLLEELSRA